MTNKGKIEMNTVKIYVIAYYSDGTTDFDTNVPTYRRLSAKTAAGAVKQTKKFLRALPTYPDYVHLLFSDGFGTHGYLNRLGDVTNGMF